jgi:hypothetical protein
MPEIPVPRDANTAAIVIHIFLLDNLLFQSIVFVLSVSLFLYPPYRKGDDRLGRATRKHALDEGVGCYLIDAKNHYHCDSETENK